MLIDGLSREQNGSQNNIFQDRAIEDLCETVVKRARKEAICFIDRDKKLEHIIKAYNPELCVADIRKIAEQEKRDYQHVILIQVLENVTEEQGLLLLRQCWKLLKAKGTLYTVVPNEKFALHDHQIRRFKASTLKKLLQSVGKPKLITAQPFKWIIMSVKKQVTDVSHVNITKLKRIQVTAKLCKGKVLELGCGCGELTDEIRKRDLDVTGVDKNEEKITIATQTYPGIKFLHCDIMELTLTKESFQTVLLPEILEHVSEPTGNRMLEIAWSFLKPGGRLIVTVPNQHCIPNPNHIRQFDRRSLRAILKKFGKPKLETNQPYKWLIMYVDKQKGVSPPI